MLIRESDVHKFRHFFSLFGLFWGFGQILACLGGFQARFGHISGILSQILAYITMITGVWGQILAFLRRAWSQIWTYFGGLEPEFGLSQGFGARFWPY